MRTTLMSESKLSNFLCHIKLLTHCKSCSVPQGRICGHAGTKHGWDRRDATCEQRVSQHQSWAQLTLAPSKRTHALRQHWLSQNTVNILSQFSGRPKSETQRRICNIPRSRNEGCNYWILYLKQKQLKFTVWNYSVYIYICLSMCTFLYKFAYIGPPKQENYFIQLFHKIAMHFLLIVIINYWRINCFFL